MVASVLLLLLALLPCAFVRAQRASGQQQQQQPQPQPQPQSTTSPVVVRTSFGEVHGVATHDYDNGENGPNRRRRLQQGTGAAADSTGVDAFLGIRYAAVGERFSPSRLLHNNDDDDGGEGGSFDKDTVLNATQHGPYCYQSMLPYTNEALAAPYLAQEQSEECLYLNIWRPSASASAENGTEPLRATMVFIHGGAWVFGSGSEPTYDGAQLARRQDVVVVTLNYRLGIFGFLQTDPSTGSGGMNGIEDQLHALQWIRQHIQSFGGDPDGVTIFGESAGSISVCVLSVLPEARGLFRRSIQQSGECAYSPQMALGDVDAGERYTRAIFNLTGAASIAELRDPLKYPPQDLAKYYPGEDGSTLWATIDYGLLLESPQTLYSDSVNVVPTDMMIGTTSADNVMVLLYDKELCMYLSPYFYEDIEAMTSSYDPDVGRAIVEAYEPSPTRYGDDNVTAWMQYWGDVSWRCGSQTMSYVAAEGKAQQAAGNEGSGGGGGGGGNVYLYNYAHLSSADPLVLFGLGEAAGLLDDPGTATHTSDNPMVFGTLQEMIDWTLMGAAMATDPMANATSETTSPPSAPLAPTAADLAMSDEMMSRWASFAKTGNPNTDEYGGWDPVDVASSNGGVLVSEVSYATTSSSSPPTHISVSVPFFKLQTSEQGTSTSTMTTDDEKAYQCSTFPFFSIPLAEDGGGGTDDSTTSADTQVPDDTTTATTEPSQPSVGTADESSSAAAAREGVAVRRCATRIALCLLLRASAMAALY